VARRRRKFRRLSALASLSGFGQESEIVVRESDRTGRRLEQDRRLAGGTALAVAPRVPSLPHELHVELFRNCAELARELLRGKGELRRSLHSKQLVASCLSNEVVQVKPAQHRADSVIVFRDHKGKARLAIVVEVQSKVDRRKWRTWPLYVAAVRERHRCPTYLLVFALEPRVADWAKTPIKMGHPDFHLKPLVISHSDVPKMDLTTAADSPELRVLRVLSQPTKEGAQDAVRAIRALSTDHSSLYLDAILDALPAAARKELEATMEGYTYRSEFARKYFFEGKRKGRKKGLEKGLEQGKERGQQDIAIEVARKAIGELSMEQIATIRSIREDSQLTALVVSLARAQNPSRARAVLTRAQNRQ
jgi:hypothetical protein